MATTESTSVTLELKTVDQFIRHLHQNDPQRPHWFHFSRMLPLQDGGPSKYLMNFSVIGTRLDIDEHPTCPLESLQKGNPWPKYDAPFSDTLLLLHRHMLQAPMLEKSYHQVQGFLVSYQVVLEEEDALAWGMPKSLLDPEKTPEGWTRASSMNTMLSFNGF